MAILTQKQEQQLLKTIKFECKANNIQLYLGAGKSVRTPDGFKCGGYFCAEGRKLAVARKNSNWVMILLHEYCHLLQWLENCEEWANSNKFRIDYISAWLSNRYVRKSKLDDVFYKTMALEHDCEKRRIDYLIKMKVSKFKIKQEIQKSNAYILFYLYVKKNRIWNLPKYPSKIKKIWSECPKNFNYNIHTSFQRIEHLYEYHL